LLTDFNAVYDQHARRQWSILVRDIEPASDFAGGVKGIGYYLGDVLQVIDRSEVKKYQLYLTDYISTLESFFRVRRRVLLTDLYQTFDFPAFGSRGLRTLDYLKTLDSVALQKSLSPLFISLLLQRRIPIRYAALVLTDYIPPFSSAVYGKTDIGITDYLSSLDLSALVRSISPLFLSLLLQRRVPVRYAALVLTDYVSLLDKIKYGKADIRISDYLTLVDELSYSGKGIIVGDISEIYELTDYSDIGIKSGEYLHTVDRIALSQKVEIGDYILGLDRILYSGNGVKITDYLSLLDLSALVRSISPSLISLLLQRRIPIRYAALVLTDYIQPFDSEVLVKSISPSLISLLLQRRVPVRYITLALTNYINSTDKVLYGSVTLLLTDLVNAYENIKLQKSLSPLFLSLLLKRRILARYFTLTLADYVSLFDYTEVGKGDMLIRDAVLSYESFGYRKAGIEIYDVFDMYEHVPSTDITVYNLWPTTYRIVNVRDLLQTFDRLRYERKSYTVIVSDLISASDGAFSVKRNITSRELINTYENVRYGRR